MMEVIAEGNHLVIKVDGKTIQDRLDEKRLFTKGHIALQQYDAATVVEFCKIEIQELPTTKAEAPAAAGAAVPPSPPSGAESGLPPEAKAAAKAFEKVRDDARIEFLADSDTVLDRLAKVKGAPEQRLKMINVVKH